MGLSHRKETLECGWPSVKLSGDGYTVILGERYFGIEQCNPGPGQAKGNVVVYKFQNGNTLEQKGQTFTGQTCGDYLGNDVDISLDGNTIAFVVLARWSSSPREVKVYDYNTGTQEWVMRGALPSIPGSNWPQHLTLSDDGSTVMFSHFAIEDQNIVSVQSWDPTTQIWTQKGSDLVSDQNNVGFAWGKDSMAMNRDKNVVAIGASVYDSAGNYNNRKGKVWIYEFAVVIGLFRANFEEKVENSLVMLFPSML